MLAVDRPWSLAEPTGSNGYLTRALACSHECCRPGVAAGLGRRPGAGTPAAGAGAAGARRLGRRAARVAGRLGCPVHPASGAGAVAGGTPANVRPDRGRATAVVLLRRGCG